MKSKSKLFCPFCKKPIKLEDMSTASIGNALGEEFVIAHFQCYIDAPEDNLDKIRNRQTERKNE